MKFVLAGAFLLAFAVPALSQEEGQVSDTTVKFFESGYSAPRQKQRVYAAKFDRSKTRYIWSEFGGTNLLYKKRAQTVALVFRYFNPDGSPFHTAESSLDLPQDWAGFFTAKGAGFSRRGRWAGGAYRVEVHSGSRKLAEGTFTIFDDVANRPAFAATPDDNVKIAVQRQKIDDIEGALLFCARALEQDPSFAAAYEARADVHLGQDKLNEAYEDASKAVECGPDRPDAYHLRALASVRLGQVEDAVKDYGRAIELNPSKAVYHRNRALARKSLGDYERSLDDVERCIKLDPNYADAYNDRGLLRQRVGDFAGAIEDFGRTLKLDPGHSYALNNRGKLHMKRGARYQARLDFEAAIDWGGDSVRGSAAESLGELGLTDAADKLAGLLWDDDAGVRRSAVSSMGRLKAKGQASEVGRLLRDPNAAVRRSAAVAIFEVGGSDYTESLEALVEEKDAIARVHAILSLCRFGVGRHAKAAVELLPHADAHLRGDAVEALGFLGDKQYAAPLVPLLKDPEAGVRIKAAAALGRMGAREHAAEIAALLNDPAMASLYDEDKVEWSEAIISDVAARTLRGWDMDPDAMRPKRAPATPRPIEGTYVIRFETGGRTWGEMTFGPVGEDGRFDWSAKCVEGKGRGVMDGDFGYYDWRTLDGDSGRATFTVDAEGRLHGRWAGGGSEWKFVGTKK